MKIRIKNPGFYDHDPAFKFLAVGTEGFAEEVWKHPWRDETIYMVRLKGKEDGKPLTFYKEELDFGK